MKQRPWPLTFYAAILLLIALSLPVQIMVQYEIPLMQFIKTFKYLSNLNFLVIALLLASSAAAQFASRTLLFLAPLAAICVTLNNIWVGYVGLNFSITETWVSSAFFLLLTVVLLEKKTRTALVKKEMQWWRTPPRAAVEKPIVLMPWNGERIASTTLDLSERGAFVICNDKSPLNVGDRMQLRMKLEGHLDVRCTARLVRKAQADSSRPAGFGIQFEDLSRRDRRALRLLVNPEKSI